MVIYKLSDKKTLFISIQFHILKLKQNWYDVTKQYQIINATSHFKLVSEDLI